MADLEPQMQIDPSLTEAPIPPPPELEIEGDTTVAPDTTSLEIGENGDRRKRKPHAPTPAVQKAAIIAGLKYFSDRFSDYEIYDRVGVPHRTGQRIKKKMQLEEAAEKDPSLRRVPKKRGRKQLVSDTDIQTMIETLSRDYAQEITCYKELAQKSGIQCHARTVKRALKHRGLDTSDSLFAALKRLVPIQPPPPPEPLPYQHVVV